MEIFDDESKRKLPTEQADFAVLIILAICGILLFLATFAGADVVDLNIIAQIESSGNSGAYNAKSGARGTYQITSICRKDYNQMTGSNIQPDDLWNPEINERIADWYLHKRIPQMLRHYGHEVTVENILIAYNWGIGNVGKTNVPRETVNYILKYKEMVSK